MLFISLIEGIDDIKSTAMIKKTLYFLLAILVIMISAMIYGVRYFNNIWFEDKPIHSSYGYDNSLTLDFIWGSQTYNEYKEPHNVMLIPMTVSDLPYPFYFQFDTGTPYTVLTGKTLSSLMQIMPKLDTTSIEGAPHLKKLYVNFGENIMNAENVRIFKNYGRSFEIGDSLTRIKLGSIGADFLMDKITTIDFKNQKIHISNQRAEWMDTVKFHPFSFQGRRFMLPAEIDGKKLKLFYDSGSSAFGLITSKYRYQKNSDPNEKEIRYSTNSWGKSLDIIHKDSDKIMFISDKKLPLKRISYVGVYENLQRFMTPFTRIGGWLGNKPFTESILVLDTQKEEFVVIPSD